MPRYIFPASSVTNTTGAPIRLAFHYTQIGGVRATDLWTVDGSNYLSAGIPNGIVLTDSAGAYSAFAGPDDVDTLWVTPHTGAARTSITATGYVAGETSLLNSTYVQGRTAVLYVAPTGGSDSNTGLTPGVPKATISAALAALPSGRGIVRALPGTHTLGDANKITLDVSKAAVLGETGTVFDCSAMSTGPAVTFTGTVNPPYKQSWQSMSHIEFIGPGLGTSVIGHSWDKATGSGEGPNRVTLDHVNVHDFGTGVYFGRHTYCVNYQGSDVHSNGIGVDSEGSGGDAGERLTFTNCIIYNNTTGIKQYNSTGELVCMASSLDYNGVHVDISDAKVFLLGCHIEKSTSSASRDFKVNGNSGTLVVVGGYTGHSPSGVSSQDYFIENNAGDAGGVFFENVHMSNIFPSTAYLATGTGRTMFTRTTTPPTSLMARLINTTDSRCVDGGFEHTVFPADDVYLSGDTVAITSRVTGTNIQLTQSSAQAHSGSKSMLMHKVGGSATNGAFQIAVPITRRAKAYGAIWVRKPGAETGSISVGFYYGANLSNSSSVPTNVKAQLIGTNTVTFTSSAYPWTQITANGESTAPAWATHIICSVNAFSLAGAADVYFDDLEVYEL